MIFNLGEKSDEIYLVCNDIKSEETKEQEEI